MPNVPTRLKQFATEKTMGKAQRVNEADLSLFPTCSFDLETTGLAADFGYILCGSVKPFGRPTKTFRIDDYKPYKTDGSDDSVLVADIVKELLKYSIVIGYNTQRFDVPFLVSRMMLHEMDIRPLSTIKHLDLIWSVRYRMRLRGASLAIAREHLGTPDEKTPLTGRLWAQAAAGSKSALDKICEHNVQDVKVLEQIARRLVHTIDLKFTLIR